MNKRSAIDWRQRMNTRRQSRTEELTLPSGMVVDVRKPDISAWVKRKTLPGHLMTLAVQTFKQKDFDPTNLLKKLNEKDMHDLMSFMALIVKETVVNPKIVSTLEGVAADNHALTDEEITEQRDEVVFVGVLVQKRGERLPIVRQLKDDEIDANEIDDDDMKAISDYALPNSGELKIPIGGGEVSLTEAENFREERDISLSSGSGNGESSSVEHVSRS